MALRMSGLQSGLDTESIVEAMMAAHRAKRTKVDNKKTKLEWKQTIWSGLNKKLYSFYTDYAGKMRLQSNYKTKKASSSDASKVTASCKTGTPNGSYSIQIDKLAAAQYVTSGKLSDYTTVNDEGETVTESVSTKTKLSDLGIGTDGATQIQVKTGKKTVSLNVDENTTVDDFLATLKSAGLSASLDTKQGRFYISASDSGLDGKFSITTNALSADQNAAQTALKNAVGYDNMSASQKREVQNVLSTLQNDPTEQNKEAALKKLQDMVDTNAKKTATNYYKDQIKQPLVDQYLLVNDADGTKTITADGKQALKDAKKWVDGDNAANLKNLEKLIDNKVNKEIATEEYKNKITDAVENGLYDAKDGSLLIDSRFMRENNIQTAFTGYADEVAGGVAADASGDALTKLGLGIVDGSELKEADSANGMVVIEAADSVVRFNGATLTSSSTTLEVNGLTLELTGKTNGEAVTVTVANDTAAVYDTVKDFVNQYNAVLTELNKYYYADSARGYDVLSEDEKKAMSDDEVEKWETKIKDSLLRRDNTLGGLTQTMRAITGMTVTASNGKKYSLANLGITTGKDYKEYGLLHIKGDEDDTVYADDENTLQNLLNEDPEIVTEVMSGLISNLYTELGKKMQASPLSSALTFYNDKEMNSQLSDYKKDLKKWDTKLADLEDRYYKQFTAMEKALAMMNSQSASLTGFFG